MTVAPAKQQPQDSQTEEKSAKAKSSKPAPSATERLMKVLDVTMKRNHYRQDALIEVMHKAQESAGYLEPEVLEFIAKKLKLPLSKVYGVATFYHLFSLKPSGAHSCVVCLGTACYVKGGGQIMADLEKELGIEAGDTTPDGQVSLMAARCIGACGIAPAVVLDGTVAGKQGAEEVVQRVHAWKTE